ncbi:nucleotidyltransferase domain-containing protein [Methylobacterium iners]|uniref:nucleotidyltransferase domain-containing protein n=1 Tax=Methylobacterium iners TaxID=418707 RepID=UPI001EE1F0CB|nr:nucleotidyltransferase domain-containing protein [Methylobacterium iners]
MPDAPHVIGSGFLLAIVLYTESSDPNLISEPEARRTAECITGLPEMQEALKKYEPAELIDLDDRTLRGLVDFAADQLLIRELWIFGSRVHGPAMIHSDVDLGIVPEDREAKTLAQTLDTLLALKDDWAESLTEQFG